MEDYRDEDNELGEEEEEIDAQFIVVGGSMYMYYLFFCVVTRMKSVKTRVHIHQCDQVGIAKAP